MKNVFIILMTFTFSIVVTIVGFSMHYGTESKVAHYVYSQQHGIELGIIWGVFIGACFLPIYIKVSKLKTHSAKVISYSTFSAAMSLTAYFMTPYFYLLSQIA